VLRPHLAAGITAAFLAGCYRYVPATVTDLAPGARVRIEVTTPRPVSITTDTGSATYRNVAAVMGRVVSLRADTLVLSGSSLVAAGRPRGEQNLRGDVVYIADTTDRLHQRRLDGAATTWAVMVPVGVIVYLLATLEFPAYETSP
jgi:hypothetical protein